ncbi:protein BatD [Pseudomonas stutzeri]|nr:protein BatD [Stutzerimonas stutzeri]
MSPMLRPVLLALVALSALLQSAAAAELRARVDRSELALGEIVELTLESDDPTLFGRPDLGVLAEQFEVLDTRLLTRPAEGAPGDLDSRLVIGLQPKLTGRLVIPPLRIGEVQSRAIELLVREAPPRIADEALAPVFVDARLEEDSVYVQAQAILTLRVYHSLALYDDSRLSPLELDDARVETLGPPRTYEVMLDGVRHGVIEVRYALFPQHSGELQIPALLFSATALAPNEGGALPFGPRSGRAVQVRSPPLTLAVKPKPADYPADAPWLPARVLTLGEHWSPDEHRVRIGDSLTHHLLLRAEGLASAQLPGLEAPIQEPWLRRYPEQPRLHNRIGETGLTGSREESIALVPTAPGRIELPALEVVWWNTVEDRLMRSRLPGRTLEVLDNPALLADTPPVLPADPTLRSARLWPWQLATVTFALTTALGFALWWRARRLPAVIRAAASGPSPRTLQDDLRRACQGNDPQATRQALDAWARQQPETLADMAARYVPLSDALDGLNAALYSESGHSWQGEALWQAIGSLPPAPNGKTPPPPSGSLPPLYPR